MIKAALMMGVGLLVPFASHAMKFSNSFTEFELPAGWTCTLGETTWSCQTSDENNQGDAVMIFAAKRKSEGDTLPNIQTFLEKPRQIKNEAGQEIASKPNYVKTSSLNGQVWVDALHIDSELPGYYTRYMATIRDDIVVLITYSIEKSKYESYVPQFDTLVHSVKVFKSNNSTPQLVRSAPPPDKLGAGIRQAQPTLPAFPENLQASKDAPVQKAPPS